MKRFLGWHHIVDRLLHIAIVALSLLFAFLLRFDFKLAADVKPMLVTSLCLAILIKPVVFHFSGFDIVFRNFFV